MHDPTDNLSPLGRRVLKLSDRPYLRLVVAENGLPAAQEALSSAIPGDVVVKNVEPAEAAGVLAGLWLYHDWLDASHTISQGIPTATGSYWHAIMHRREGDFSNARYWYARCRSHPALATLGQQVSAIVKDHPADKSLLRVVIRGWDPEAFTALVEQVHANPEDPRHGMAVALQQIEWRTLFEYCTRVAGGAAG